MIWQLLYDRAISQVGISTPRLDAPSCKQVSQIVVHTFRMLPGTLLTVSETVSADTDTVVKNSGGVMKIFSSNSRIFVFLSPSFTMKNTRFHLPPPHPHT